MSEGGDHVPNGLVNVPDHLATATGISIVTHAVSVAPHTMNASFESKFKEASISFLRGAIKDVTVISQSGFTQDPNMNLTRSIDTIGQRITGGRESHPVHRKGDKVECSPKLYFSLP